jgi:arylsulfatase
LDDVHWQQVTQGDSTERVMSEQQALVLVAGYQDLDVARGDFEALASRVRSKDVDLKGAVLVAKDADGNASVVDTGNHLGRKGAGWGAGVGVAVGLFASALTSAAVSAVASEKRIPVVTSQVARFFQRAHSM